MKKILLFLVAGSVVLGGCATSNETASTTARTSSTTSDRNVKIINGKRYVFVAPELGSNIPGRWVPESSPAAQMARQTGTIDPSVIQNTQSAPGQGLPGGG
ncbi:MAG: hypothetical protein H0X34_10340 [Chthoniobacterales bacterium]|nr:hypothetical protein [Chthoniobacterales bacterium]